MSNGRWSAIPAGVLAVLALGSGCGSEDEGGERALTVIDVGTHPSGVAVTDAAVWVSDPDDATVTRVDPRTGAIVATVEGVTDIGPDQATGTVVPGPGSPDGVAATDTTVWVTNGGEADGYTLTRIDAASGQIEDITTIGESTSGVAATDTAVWLADFDGSVTRIDPRTGEVVDTIDLGDTTPGDVAATDATVWVADVEGGSLLRIDPDTGEVVDTIDVGADLTAVAATDTSVWVTHADQGTLTQVDVDA